MKYITSDQAREIDKKLIESGFTIEQLVEIAGFAAFEVIISIIQAKNLKIVIFIGPGNNGADGLVISRWLKLIGHDVYIYTNESKLSELNKKLLNICLNLEIKLLKEFPDFEPDFIIDAIFGFSFSKEIKEPYFSMIEYMRNKNNVISIDVPSGYEINVVKINASFKPDYVISMVAPKICCKGLNCFVTRAFIPRSIFFDPEFSDYVSFRHLKE